MTHLDKSQTPPRLSGHHRQTYDAVFRHPAARNLAWHDVRSLLDAVANVVEGRQGALTVTWNGQSMSLHAPAGKGVATAEDLLAIRNFLEQVGAPARGTDEEAPRPRGDRSAAGTHRLVVIDHHEAKVYHAGLHEGRFESLVPYDPHGFGRHLRSKREGADGKRKPERKSFYDAVAAALRGADRILIFGSGTGESSAMEHLLAGLKEHHSDVFARVIGSVVVDAHHTTEAQLLAHGEELFGREAGQR